MYLVPGWGLGKRLPPPVSPHIHDGTASPRLWRSTLFPAETPQAKCAYLWLPMDLCSGPHCKTQCHQHDLDTVKGRGQHGSNRKGASRDDSGCRGTGDRDWQPSLAAAAGRGSWQEAAAHVSRSSKPFPCFTVPSGSTYKTQIRRPIKEIQDCNHKALKFKCRTFLSDVLCDSAGHTPMKLAWLLGFWLKFLGKLWGPLLRWGKSENYAVCKGKSGLQFNKAKFQMPLMYLGKDVKEAIGNISLELLEVLVALKCSGS